MAKPIKKLLHEAKESPIVSSQRNHHNLFWNSTLFNEVYLQNDVPIFHTDVWVDDEVNFDQFLTQFQNFVETMNGENPNTWSERTTINRLIKPILEMLGYVSVSNDNVEPWLEDESFSVQEMDGLKTYKPDFIIVNDHKELKYIQNEKTSEKKLAEARNSVILPIEAKYWGRIDEYRQSQKEDSKRADKKNNGETSRVMDFDEQCLKYMEILNKEYGVLTDGKTWRLYNLSFSSPSFRPYFQFNLGHMIKHIQNSDFLSSTSDYQMFKEEIKYFYFLFRKKALFSDSGEELFVDELLSYSKKYVARVEEDLKNRFVNAMTIACNGFHRAQSKSEDINIELIRSVSESHIFNILFLKYCEARNILPIKQDPEGYRKISISNILDRLDKFDPNKEEDNLNELLLKRMFVDINYNPNETQLYERLLKLTKIVQNGTNEEFNGFSIKGFKESIFSQNEWDFVQKFKLTNQEMIRILFELGYSESGIQGRKYQQIPYNSFSPRQLGSIYESFLEFKLDKAPQDMAFIKKQWVPANLKSDKIRYLDVPKVKKGNLFFTPNNKDRKVTGSYYTPDYIVREIVAGTIGDKVKGLDSKEILNLKICDPAMGSGHFLNAVLNYLSQVYLGALEKETNDDITMNIVEAKRIVLHNCIYGVDINHRAVKLTKMSLWLESATASKELENLQDQILCGDSVNIESFNWEKEFSLVFKNKRGFDAVVMNPPYLGIKDNTHIIGYLRNLKEWKDIVTNKYDLFYFFFARSLQITNSEGKIGAITTSYWPTADGAEKVRTYICNHGKINGLVFFNDLKLFKDAKGQHNLITYLSKTQEEDSINIINIKAKRKSYTLQSLDRNSLKSEEAKGNIVIRKYISSLNNKELMSLSEKGWNFETEGGGGAEKILDKIKTIKTRLPDFFDIHSGIETGADRVTKKHIEPKSTDGLDRSLKKYKEEIESNGVKIGDGVFVITSQELKNLNLPKDDIKKYIKPLIKNGSIKTDFLYDQNNSTSYLVYFKNGDLSKNSKIEKHLSKYKVILENRYKYRTEDRLEWFDLHRPLNEELIKKPKIICPYRAVVPRFSFVKEPSYALLDVFFITPLKEETNYHLALGLLNSSVIWYWLRSEGKTKGPVVETTAKPLKGIPFENITFLTKEIESVKSIDIDKQSFDPQMDRRKAALLMTSVVKKAIANKDSMDKYRDVINILAASYFGLTKKELEIIKQELSEFEAAEFKDDDIENVA